MYRRQISAGTTLVLSNFRFVGKPTWLPSNRTRHIKQFAARGAVSKDWLETDKSQEIGWNPEGGESKGHQSGRYICDLLPKKDSDFTDEDLQHMSHVNAYCKRHLAQRPKNVEDSKWRYSLMNWGHDPTK